MKHRQIKAVVHFHHVAQGLLDQLIAASQTINDLHFDAAVQNACAWKATTAIERIIHNAVVSAMMEVCSHLPRLSRNQQQKLSDAEYNTNQLESHTADLRQQDPRHDVGKDIPVDIDEFARMQAQKEKSDCDTATGRPPTGQIHCDQTDL